MSDRGPMKSEGAPRRERVAGANGHLGKFGELEFTRRGQPVRATLPSRFEALA